MLIFKAFSALLSYPSAEMREALPEIVELVRASKLIALRERAALLDLVEEIGEGDLLTAEERYVDLFDRGKALSLHLFEHLHGDGRDRGVAMVELKALYGAAGFELSTSELPDYLPVVLEYLSQRDMAEARDMLSGGQGRARQWAIGHQLQVGAYLGAADLVRIDQAHIMADTESLGEAGVAWLERLERDTAPTAPH